MEILMYAIGILFVISAIIIKLFIIFNIKFEGIELHKVEPKKVTVVEKGGSNITPSVLKPGLYPVIWVKPFYVPKRKNLPLYQFSIEPLAGMEENWNDWETKSKHPIDTIDWETVSGIELQGGSMTLVEFILIFKIIDPIKFLYNNENSIETLVSIAKGIIKDAVSVLSFSEVMTLSHSDQKEIFKRVKGAVERLEMGVMLIAPDDGAVIKNLYPCPETKAGRALRFEAKQKGKAEVEIATGKAKGNAILGKGRGEGIKEEARAANLTPEQIYVARTGKEIASELNDALVISTGNSKDLTNSIAELAGVAGATSKVAANKKVKSTQGE